MPSLNLTASRTLFAFGQLGSFWNSLFAQPLMARKLLTLTDKGQCLATLANGIENLAGDSEWETVRNKRILFSPESVVQTGEILYDTPLGDVPVYGTPSSYQEVYNGGTVQYWMLPVQNGIIPLSIQTGVRKLMVGIDFFIAKDQYIFFRVDPRLFQDGNNYTVVTGRRRRRSYLDCAIGIATHGRPIKVAQYCRNYQTPKYFIRALAEIAGLACLEWEQKLIAMTETGLAVVYTFELETFRVEYPHDRLAVGQTYPANYVIGDAIRVDQCGGRLTDWWRATDWQGGISLDPLVNQKGLRLLDANVPAIAVSQDPNEKLHVRFPLSDDSAQDDLYWAEVHARETQQGYYLNDIVGLTSVGESMIVNPLDIFFQAVLNPRVTVLTIKSSQITNLYSLLRFIAQESPLGSLMLVLEYGPGLSDAFSLTGNETAMISQQKLEQCTEHFSLDNGVDFARIKPETPIQ